MGWCQVMMKAGKQREWSCQSHSATGGKALRGLEGGLSHSVTLKQTPSCNFTPTVSEDSATGARLPEALQAENTGSITQRHMGSLCSALPGRKRQTPDAAVHVFLKNLRGQICQEEAIIIMLWWPFEQRLLAIHLFLRQPKYSSALACKDKVCCLTGKIIAALAYHYWLAGRQWINKTSLWSCSKCTHNTWQIPRL